LIWSKNFKQKSDPLNDENTILPPRGKSRRPGSFFGRRKAQKLKARKQGLVDNLLPHLVLDLNDKQPVDIAHLFDQTEISDHKIDTFRMEIGFGGGEHLAKEAELNRDTGFIGIEPFINGMAKMLGEIEEHDLGNVRLYDEDAALAMDWLPAECLSRVDLLYPDPWPKKKQLKRRFVSQPNLDRIARILKPGGEFRFASDIEGYVNWTLLHCSKHPLFKWTAKCADDWHQPWPNWHLTRYEAKAKREGRTPAYLIFKKQ
jgi:tRNA (guanine-N7-)-methyltransferase